MQDSTASSTSSFWAEATLFKICSLDGLRLSNVAPDFAATHYPWINSLSGALYDFPARFVTLTLEKLLFAERKSILIFIKSKI